MKHKVLAILAPLSEESSFNRWFLYDVILTASDEQCGTDSVGVVMAEWT